jgi:hypothetical protein
MHNTYNNIVQIFAVYRAEGSEPRTGTVAMWRTFSDLKNNEEFGMKEK